MAVTEPSSKHASDRVIAFGWSVSASYEWVSSFGSDSKVQGQYLAPTSGPERRSQPLEEAPTLFRTFADLRPTRAKIRAFALGHGHLGGWALEPLAEEGSRVQDGELVATWVWGERRGELLATWANEIRAMREAVELADAVRGQDVASLRRWFRIEDGIARYSRTINRGDDLLPWSTHLRIGGAGRSEHLGRNDEAYLRAARFLLQDLANEKLQRETAMRLVYLPPAEGDSLERRMVPLSLLGALWMQLAESIDGGLDYRRCENEKCGAWYLIRRENDRKTRRFCRGACKVASWRHHRRLG